MDLTYCPGSVRDRPFIQGMIFLYGGGVGAMFFFPEKKKIFLQMLEKNKHIYTCKNEWYICKLLMNYLLGNRILNILNHVIFPAKIQILMYPCAHLVPIR
jgi:hypothetical protein